LQGVPNKEVSKSKILNMVWAMRSFENNDEETLKNGYRVMHVKRTSSTWQTDTVNAPVKQKGEQEYGEDESEICTAIRSLNSWQKQAIITNYFSK
jgi:hypothetical protein